MNKKTMCEVLFAIFAVALASFGLVWVLEILAVFTFLCQVICVLGCWGASHDYNKTGKIPDMCKSFVGQSRKYLAEDLFVSHMLSFVLWAGLAIFTGSASLALVPIGQLAYYSSAKILVKEIDNEAD